MLREKARLSAGFRQGTAVMALFLGGGDELPQAGGGDGGTQPYGHVPRRAVIRFSKEAALELPSSL